MRIGTVARLWRFPIKSLAPEELERAQVEADGFAGDRASALVVTSPGHARTGKTYRGKEHPRLHTVATTDAALALGQASGVALDRVTGTHFFDAEPVSLLFDTWLSDAEALVGRSLEPLRYRPNIFANADPAFTLREADIVGRAIAIDDVVLTVTAAINRCVTTTYDLATGESDLDVLRVVAQHRDNVMGVYCAVTRTGTITAGSAMYVS